MLEKMDRGAKWALSKVDATDKQRAEITAILDDLAPDALRWRKEHQDLAGRFAAALVADQVDVAQIEQLRIAGLSLVERTFTRSFEAMVKAAEP